MSQTKLLHPKSEFVKKLQVEIDFTEKTDKEVEMMIKYLREGNDKHSFYWMLNLADFIEG